MATSQLAERFGAVSMTLEMPFKDNDDLPCARKAGARSAASCWGAIAWRRLLEWLG